jgi:hypothetical protein
MALERAQILICGLVKVTMDPLMASPINIFSRPLPLRNPCIRIIIIIDSFILFIP